MAHVKETRDANNILSELGIHKDLSTRMLKEQDLELGV
jgi:hypothetical protein